MPKPLIYTVYILLLAFGLLAMYSILNAGSPDSLLRIYFPDARTDVYVAVGSSLIVFVLGFVVFFSRDIEGFRNLIEMNAERIRELRQAGRSDADIAESILMAMGSHGGYKHNMARKKLILHLSQFR